LKASNGFWKIGWTWRMKSRRARVPRTSRRSVPRKRIVPALGGTMLRIMRASVVLPLPDSPITVTISGLPSSSRRLTPSTAANFRRASRPPLE
jgi:hypothetical protein